MLYTFLGSSQKRQFIILSVRLPTIGFGFFDFDFDDPLLLLPRLAHEPVSNVLERDIRTETGGALVVLSGSTGLGSTHALSHAHTGLNMIQFCGASIDITLYSVYFTNYDANNILLAGCEFDIAHQPTYGHLSHDTKPHGWFSR